MANIKSAQKRARQSEVHRARNSSLRSRMRTAIKRVRKAIGAGDKTQARTILGEAAGVIDSTVTKGVVHANAAARYKSRLAAAVKAMA